jgi:hypothetical protein
MPYVKARYQIPDPIMPPTGGARQVIATDDQGLEWSLAEDSKVGDWLDYLASGGTIQAAVDPTETTA